jgi:hypothetical protein
MNRADTSAIRNRASEFDADENHSHPLRQDRIGGTVPGISLVGIIRNAFT